MTPRAPKGARERIDVLLVERGLCDSRARAQARVLAGEVIVDDRRVDKAGEKVPRDAHIRLKGQEMPWVSRGGLKLDAALAWFGVDPAGLVCVDIGASTGGFTDVLLQRGAARVFAVDVGYGQLAHRLRSDARVTNLERTHIVKLAVGTLSPAPRLAVVDVSFISLVQVLPALLPHLAADARVVCLIKPQFEVGKGAVGKGGIVRDADARAAAVERVLATAAAAGLVCEGVKESPITGADGNIEVVAAFARAC
ncbi:MAG: TlyA family RNA methyltransferase [Deltaproteobacteria bacterium]|nr:TlyA family RNA methyltransferase [Deltaproteobacteria bacterium]